MDENAATLDSETRKILDTVMQHDNIPRKKAKFMNFVKNILRHVRPAAIDNTWELFEQALKPKVEEEPPKEKPSPKVEDNSTVDEDNDESNEADESRQGVPMFTGRQKPSKKAKKKDKGKENQTNGDAGSKKKRKREADPEEEVEAKKANREEPDLHNENGSASPEKSGKFVWEDVITGLLQKKGAMKVNKLKKKVVAEYLSQHEGTHKSEEELANKLEKKLKKNKSFRILKDVVSLHE